MTSMIQAIILHQRSAFFNDIFFPTYISDELPSCGFNRCPVRGPKFYSPFFCTAEPLR